MVLSDSYSNKSNQLNNSLKNNGCHGEKNGCESNQYRTGKGVQVINIVSLN